MNTFQSEASKWGSNGVVKERQLIGLSLAAFLLMLGDGMVLALLPQKVIALTQTTTFVGYLASTYAFAQVLAQIPIGMLADRMGFRVFIVMGYLISCLAGLLYYVSDNSSLIFLGRSLQGVGEAPILGLAPALLSLSYSNRKGKVIGIYNAAIHFGLTAGPLMGALVFKVWSDNQIFLFYASMCLAGAIISGYCLEPKLQQGAVAREATDISGIMELAKSPYVLLVLLGITLYGAGYGMFLTNIPAFLLTVRNFKPDDLGIFFSLFYGAISLAQLITGSLSDRLGRRLFMITGLIIAAVGLVVSADFEQFALSLMLSVASFGLGIFYLSSMAFVNEIVPDTFKGTISGAYYLFWGIGMFLGPLILANYMECNGYCAGFQLFALLLVIEASLLTCFKEN
jgi:MFS family permease